MSSELIELQQYMTPHELAELDLLLTSRPMGSYQADPVAYAHDVLGASPWSKQREIARALLKPPHRVLVKACHNVGKTWLAGVLVNWFYDCFTPGIALTTAPTDRQVRDLLWKEIRTQRGARGGFRGPKMPRLEQAANHFAHGFTAKDADSFQGHHAEHMLFVFDEAVGVDSVFWETAESMFGAGGMWLAIFNPTDTSSQAYQEELSGAWNVISLSVLDHPNIEAELANRPAPYPSAIRLARVNDLLKKWCRPVEGKPKSTDIEWPPHSGQWLRPGPIAEARLLGRWPSQATNNVWSDAAWQVAEQLQLPEPDEPVEIGCDVARFGDDFTEMHVRRGPVSLHHEAANGLSITETAGRLKQLAAFWGQHAGMVPTQVAIKTDDDGVGGGVVDLLSEAEYNVIPVSAGSAPIDREGYPNRRSELWFAVADRANDGRLDLSRLDPEVRRELRRQAMAPTWWLDSQGRRVVEPKADTKKRLKRSPDGIDALDLAYAPDDGRLLLW